MTEEKSEAHLVTVANGVHAWIGAGGDSNAGAIETPEGIIVIDTQQYPRLAHQLRAAVLGTAAAPAFSTSRQSKAPFRVIKNVRLAKSLRVAGADRG
jgi:hypothetical protein